MKELFTKFKKLPRRQQERLGMLGVILALLVVISVGFSVINYLDLDIDPVAAVTATEQNSEEEQLPADDVAPEQINPETLLPDEVKNYSEDKKVFVQTLKNSKWFAEENTATFEDATIIEKTLDGNETKRSFIVKELKKSKTYTDNDSYEAIVAFGDKYAIMKMVPSTPVTTDPLVAKLINCDLFSHGLNGTYKQDLDSAFALVPVTDTVVLNAIGNDTQGLEGALQSYCAQSLPEVSSATWTGVYTVFDEDKSIMVYFSCNNAPKTELCVTYIPTTKAFNVSTDRSRL